MRALIEDSAQEAIIPAPMSCRLPAPGNKRNYFVLGVVGTVVLQSAIMHCTTGKFVYPPNV